MRKKIMAVILSAVMIAQNLSVCAAYNAEDVGLLTREEARKFTGDEALDCGMFKTLLERMLEQKRYLYCPTELPEARGWDFDELQIDLTGSVTYMEWIKTSWE